MNSSTSNNIVRSSSKWRQKASDFKKYGDGGGAPVSVSANDDISKSYYHNGFVICFLRSIYGRFIEFLIETFNKGFSCSWIFLAFHLGD